MVQEGRLDMEEVDRLCGSVEKDLSTEEIADILEEALRQNLQVTTFDPVQDGFPVQVNWGTGLTVGRLLGSKTLYILVDDDCLDEEAIWDIWDGDVWVALVGAEGATWLFRDPTLVTYNNQRWIKATAQ